MGTAESIQLVDKLVKAKIPKSTATELVDRIDKGNDSSPYWLKWIVGTGFVAMFSGMYYLHSDTKADMRELKADLKNNISEVKDDISEVKDDISEVKDDISEIRKELKELRTLILQRR